MRKRHGFTLIELLVAMALIIFIMSILSYAFVAATTAFRDLKAAGDMAEKLRSATTILQRDLSADHFDGRRRLSDLNFWSNGPPRQGFFRIWQFSANNAPPQTSVAPNAWELNDLDGIPSFRSVNHALHFTVHLRGNRLSDFFTAKVRPGSPLVTSQTLGLLPSRYEDQDATQSTFNSQWAEVVYFLRPAVDPATGAQETANGTPLFTLYRRQLLLVNDNSLVSPEGYSAATAAQYLEVSCGADPTQPTKFYFNSPFDVTVPQRRFGVDPTTGLPSVNVAGLGLSYPRLADQTNDPNMLSADVLLTDVVSFDVRVLLPTANTAPLNGIDPFVDLFDATIQTSFNHGNSLFPAAGPQVFDTWSSVRDPLATFLTSPLYDYSSWGQPGAAVGQTPQVSIPLWNSATNTGPIIKAIQIQLRIWDTKTQQTRQVTIVQAM